VAGADTLVFCKGRVIGKPKDKKDALKMLKTLNGAWQSVYTGVALVNIAKKKVMTAYEVTRCKAGRLSLAELEKIADKHLDKAGGYAMQDKDDPLIEKVCGSESNVVGMPMELFKELFLKFKRKEDL
jgi:septum formation protein